MTVRQSFLILAMSVGFALVAYRVMSLETRLDLLEAELEARKPIYDQMTDFMEWYVSDANKTEFDRVQQVNAMNKAELKAMQQGDARVECRESIDGGTPECAFVSGGEP